jgi:hypothetical protein
MKAFYEMQVTTSGIFQEVEIFDRGKLIEMFRGTGKKSPSRHRLVTKGRFKTVCLKWARIRVTIGLFY